MLAELNMKVHALVFPMLVQYVDSTTLGWHYWKCTLAAVHSWSICCSLWPVYSPVSPHCLATGLGHRNRWYLSGSYAEETKEGCCCNRGHLCTLYMTQSLWETSPGGGTGHMSLCGLLSWLFCETCRFPSEQRLSHIPGRASRGYFEVSDLVLSMDGGVKLKWRER